MAKRKRSKRPFVLVTVSGGVATIWDVPGVDTDLVDWDIWDGQDPTRDDLKCLREIAERIRNRGDKARFLRQVQELEDCGVAEDEDDDDDDDDWAELREMTKVEMDDKRRRRKQIPKGIQTRKKKWKNMSETTLGTKSETPNSEPTRPT